MKGLPLLTVAAMLSISAVPVIAAPGDLDPSFGSGGKVTTSLGSSADVAQALVVQRDGKLVAAGSTVSDNNRDFALVRYDNDGNLDSSFGSGGKVTTPFGGN